MPEWATAQNPLKKWNIHFWIASDILINHSPKKKLMRRDTFKITLHKIIAQRRFSRFCIRPKMQKSLSEPWPWKRLLAGPNCSPTHCSHWGAHAEPEPHWDHCPWLNATPKICDIFHSQTKTFQKFAGKCAGTYMAPKLGRLTMVK